MANNTNRHPFLTATACNLGYQAVASLIDASLHGRCTADAVANVLNHEQKLDAESREAWTPEAVRVAIRSGAFDKPGKREFYDFRGRYGSIRDVDIEAEENVKARSLRYAEAARKRKETRAAKSAVQSSAREPRVARSAA